ncbi:MAG TPA: hypothetical protein VK593_09835, partial [Edaphobacter sp.]|nr:hypothetical protein [Edaphobacter sp.]
MSKEIYISSTPHETRLAIIENDALTEIYYERENEYTLAGSIYNGRVTRVLPGMQSSFVDIGLERDAFLYITDFMEEAGDTADFEAEGSQRSGRREPTTLEGSTPAERPERSERERGGRGRSGRRDRGGNRDRQQSGESSAPQSSEDQSAEEGYSAEPLNIPVLSEEGGAESIGEGAPGADGSRRWRGRRGRRRGRGRQPGEDQSPETPAVESDSYDAPVDLDAAAEPHVHPEIPEIGSGVNEYPQESSSRREDRGGRDRGRGGRNRDGRRAPRGFAPKVSSYGIENQGAEEGSAQGEAAPEPIVLPGESLSKYRKGGEQPEGETRSAAPIAAAPSAPSYEIPAGWDGGMVLPGESLSRRRRPESAPVKRSVLPVEPQPVEPQPVEPTAEPVSASLPETLEEIVSVSTPEAAETVAVPVVAKPEEPVDYEPTEASASHRFDPVPPREFRQSAPFEQEVEPAVVEIAAQHSELPHAEIEEVEFVDEEEPVLAEADEPAVHHEVTSIHASGEMVSPVPTVDEVETEVAHQVFEGETEVEEEEEIDETALDPATLFASSIEELDDFDEEETLEGTADLGTMIREMSIDQITHAGLDDEEDLFEEEDAVDDGGFASVEAEDAAVEADDLEDESSPDEYAEESEP